MSQPQYTIGILLFPGFEVLDVFGPAEAFGSTRYLNQAVDDLGPRPFKIYYLAEKLGPVMAGNGGGVQVIPDATLHAPPKLDLLLIPGGLGTRKEIYNQALVEWIHTMDREVQLMTSVCTGAALLAQTGLLNDRQATTNHRAFDWVVQASPKEVKWTRELRWVHDGRYVTSAGVSAGTDMAIALIEELCGKEVAAATVQGMEYRWERDPHEQPV